MRKRLILVHALCLFLLLSMTGHAQSIDQIIKKANHVAYYNGKDGRAKVQMLIKDSQGRSRKRSFTILRKNIDTKTDGEQKFYVYFNRPTDMQGTVFLVWKKMEGDDDRWMYFPALDLVKRIAGGDKRTSFVGSTFLYEDVSGRRLSADEHKLLKTTGDAYVVESVPVDKSGVKFSKYIAHVDKKSFIPLKIEYYNSKGKVYRIYENKKWEMVQGNPTVIIASMKDLDTGVETYNRYTNVEYDIDIDESIFSERYLRKAPLELINY